MTEQTLVGSKFNLPRFSSPRAQIKRAHNIIIQSSLTSFPALGKRMSSSDCAANPLHPPSDGGKSRRVTFANTGTRILVIGSDITSPVISPKSNVRDRIRALRARRATPHKKGPPSWEDIISSPSSSRSGASASAAAGGRGGGVSVAHIEKKTPRLVESGAVRVQIARHTNARRGEGKHGSDRLIDSGAVRLNVTRHTTPRRLYATRGGIWSPPPPSSGRVRRAPRSVEQILPSSSRQSNAHVGGHKFLAALSPKYSTPAIRMVTYEEQYDERNAWGLSRTLFN